MHLNPPLEL